MSEEIDHLRKRVQELENVARDYGRLQHLIDYAAQGQDMARYMAMSVLYIDPTSRSIVDVNDATIELLGYPRSNLLTMTIDELEIAVGEKLDEDEDPMAASVYSAIYKHRSGYTLPLTVHKRSLHRENRPMVYYRLADTSLHRRLWYEFQRREDDGFNFQQKLTTLTEVTVELSKIESFDALCYQIIKLGIERLGFDRIGLWLVDTEHGLMRGTYGVDEEGNIRPEHDQSWSYVGRHISEFISGKTDKPLVFDASPLYNEKSEIIHYGWQLTVPVLHGQLCIGTLAADNYRYSQPIRNYEPELLRLYGITAAHLMELSRSREQATALRVAQQLSHMLSEFITNIGHDFRTPLSIINNNTYLLQRSGEPERRQVLANGVQEQVRHISSMVDRALEFVAFQRNPTLTLSPVNVFALLTSIVQKHNSSTVVKHIQVDIAIDETSVVLADAEYLSRALSEIFENAVQYTTLHGKIQLESMIYPHEIGIRIRDKGIGMDKLTLSRLFDPLYRGDQARTERHSGLGLAISKAIVEAHGGRIVVDSIPGIGSLFEVILPQ